MSPQGITLPQWVNFFNRHYLGHVLTCILPLELFMKSTPWAVHEVRRIPRDVLGDQWWHSIAPGRCGRRRLDHAVLFKSFISVTHCPSQRNWWIVQIYGIPMPEQVGIFFRGFARLMKVSHCPSGSSLVIAMTWRTARARILKCEVSHVKQLPVDSMGVKCVSVECDQPLNTFQNISNPTQDSHCVILQAPVTLKAVIHRTPVALNWARIVLDWCWLYF